MSIEFIWRLPVAGDGRAAHSADWNRGDYQAQGSHRNQFSRLGANRDGYTYYDHLLQIGRAAEISGFNALFIGQSAAGEEPQIVAGALAREVRRLRFIVSLPAGLVSAVYSAKIANSFQRLSGGRLNWHLYHSETKTPAWHGRSWTLAGQLDRSAEFLTLTKGFWQQAPYSFEGRYFLVENGGFPPALQGERYPTVYLDGNTDAQLQLSARHADVHILPVAPLAEITQQVAQLKHAASEQGRAVKVYLSADVIARRDDDAAWQEVQQRFAEATVKTVPLHGTQNGVTDFDQLRQDAVIWRGFDYLREGEAAGLVGGYDTIATRLLDYINLGITGFVLGANPHLEEAWRLGEHLLPRVREALPGKLALASELAEAI
ncbi:LLM class flavin-dependent oxidoreductase [Rheinheimera muenzenbergensis]|uniref:LLM class flavin-dependent oxidoreductase n=1 Tax=Rheinheimera muenzenbergensis TaxID=1193628 RepID=A0ABU8C4J1_9GAMM